MIRLHFTNGNRTEAQKLDFQFVIWSNFDFDIESLWCCVTYRLATNSSPLSKMTDVWTPKWPLFLEFSMAFTSNLNKKSWPSTDWYRSFRSCFQITVALARKLAFRTENDNDSYFRLTERLTLINICFCAKNYGHWFRQQIFLFEPWVMLTTLW